MTIMRLDKLWTVSATIVHGSPATIRSARVSIRACSDKMAILFAGTLFKEAGIALSDITDVYVQQQSDPIIDVEAVRIKKNDRS